MEGKSSNSQHCELIVILSSGPNFQVKIVQLLSHVLKKRKKPAISQRYLSFFLHAKSD